MGGGGGNKIWMWKLRQQKKNEEREKWGESKMRGEGTGIKRKMVGK